MPLPLLSAPLVDPISPLLTKEKGKIKGKDFSHSDWHPLSRGPPKGFSKGIQKGSHKGADKGKSWGKVPPPPVFAPPANLSPPSSLSFDFNLPPLHLLPAWAYCPAPGTAPPHFNAYLL